MIRPTSISRSLSKFTSSTLFKSTSTSTRIFPCLFRTFSSASPAPKTVFTAQVHTVGGRGAGRITSKDGNLTLSLAKPKEMGGKGEPGTNPEQLFAAGYSACFQGAMGVASQSVLKKELPSATSIDAKVAFLRTDLGEGRFKLHLSVEFDINVPGFTKEEAQKVVDAAHQICPYSNATRGNIPVKLNVV